MGWNMAVMENEVFTDFRLWRMTTLDGKETSGASHVEDWSLNIVEGKKIFRESLPDCQWHLKLLRLH